VTPDAGPSAGSRDSGRLIAPSRRVIELSAPAKVNFGLHITGVRDDGYHLIDSIFVPLRLLEDSVRVEVLELDAATAGVEIEVRGAPAELVPRDDRNLAFRAAREFMARASLSARLRVNLTKQIPSAAGLGGGPSDAGAVLRALAQLYPRALPVPSLAELALGLGADVPFFLDPRPVRVSGVGERIELLGGLPALWLLLANPGISLSTAEVYGGFDRLSSALTPGEAGSTMRAPSAPASLQRAGGIGARLDALVAGRRATDSLFENDLESAAQCLCPAIPRLRERLRQVGALATGMSGSGATVFGVFACEDDAHRAHMESDLEPPVWTRVAMAEGSRSDEGARPQSV